MEIHPGVYVSDVRTGEWEADPEVGGEMHVLCSDGSVEAGLSRFDDVSAPVEWILPARETIMVVEGHARIEIAGGPTLELGPGDIASLPAGADTKWHLTTPFKEFWVLSH